MTKPVSLVVLGDSTAFTDALGPQLPSMPHLYPNVAATELHRRLDRPVRVSVVAQPGATVGTVVHAVTKERHVQFDLLANADAVVIGVGSFDHAPAGVPPAVQAVVPYLRPIQLRRRVRSGLHRAYPHLVRLRHGYGPRTPSREFDRRYRQLLDQVRSVTWGRVAGVALGPTSHRSSYYALRHPGFPRAEARQLAIAAAHGFTPIPVWPFVVDHLDALNPDGIHWPASVHAEVGRVIAASLAAQLLGEVPKPGLPERYARLLSPDENGEVPDEAPDDDTEVPDEGPNDTGEVPDELPDDDSEVPNDGPRPG